MYICINNCPIFPEYVPGGTLQNLADMRGKFLESEIKFCAAELIIAVKTLHKVSALAGYNSSAEEV
jgi:serine/threonine protein kinase